MVELRTFHSRDELNDALDALNEEGIQPEAAGCDAWGTAFLASLMDLGDEAPMTYYVLNAEGRIRDIELGDDPWVPAFPVTMLWTESVGSQQ